MPHIGTRAVPTATTAVVPSRERATMAAIKGRALICHRRAATTPGHPCGDAPRSNLRSPTTTPPRARTSLARYVCLILCIACAVHRIAVCLTSQFVRRAIIYRMSKCESRVHASTCERNCYCVDKWGRARSCFIFCAVGVRSTSSTSMHKRRCCSDPISTTLAQVGNTHMYHLPRAHAPP